MSIKYFFLDLSRVSWQSADKVLDLYAAHLRDEGYARTTACRKIRVIARYIAWLEKRGVALKKASMLDVRKYMDKRNPLGRQLRMDDIFTIGQFMDILRKTGMGNLQLLTPPNRQSAFDKMVTEYAEYLATERALAKISITQYKLRIEQFLKYCAARGVEELSTLCSADIVGFITKRAVSLSRDAASFLCSALRSFLRFARYKSYIEADLAASVPTVRNWATPSVQKALPRDQVVKVLACCDRQNSMGQRDYAILLLLARLGLRAGEIVSLKLEDIDWDDGFITIHGKGGNLTQMSLPVDVGEAIALYLRISRPKSRCRAMFLTVRAPFRRLAGPSVVGNIVKSALRRAGIKAQRNGAHQFRHALAIELLRSGSSLEEISEVLRHRTIRSTTVYAKVDFVSLRSMGLPWSGGAYE